MPVNGFNADVMTADGHKRALQGRSLPVDDVQGVEVAQCACNLGSVEPGSGLQEDPLPLEMVEKLGRRQRPPTSNTLKSSPPPPPSLRRCESDTHLSAVDIVQNKVQLVCSLEGVVQPHQEGMLDVLHQHAALSHDVLLLDGTKTDESLSSSFIHSFIHLETFDASPPPPFDHVGRNSPLSSS